MVTVTLLQSVLALASLVAASPYRPVGPRISVPQEHYEVSQMRASTAVNPAAVFNMKCLDANAHIVSHDQDVAELGICGGIAGPIQKCGGSRTSTTGQSGTARFTLDAATPGASITLSKSRWDQCVRAARAVCPTGSLVGTCAGGASTGDVHFTLSNP